MATFHFELVSPDKVSFSGEVDQVDVPGSEGDFGVLVGHAPLIALLRPGLMTVYAAGEKTELAIFGGFAEVGPDGLTVLADYAAPTDNTDVAARMSVDIEQLEKTIAQTEPGSELDKLITRLDHFRALDEHMQGTAMH
jgi:F-type H+-transporting ATPase subunit epsilon